MAFTDITAVPISEARKTEYVAFSKRMAEVHFDHGATRITAYWQVQNPGNPQDFHADVVTYDENELSDFTKVLGAGASELVAVTLTERPSREARDRGIATATSDARVRATVDEEPVFDGSRLIASSFENVMTLDR